MAPALGGRGRQRLEDGGEPLDRAVVSADHQRVALLEPPDAARSASVDEVEALGHCGLVALLRVLVVGVAAIDEGVALVHQRLQLGDVTELVRDGPVGPAGDGDSRAVAPAHAGGMIQPRCAKAFSEPDLEAGPAARQANSARCCGARRLLGAASSVRPAGVRTQDSMVVSVAWPARRLPGKAAANTSPGG